MMCFALMFHRRVRGIVYGLNAFFVFCSSMRIEVEVSRPPLPRSHSPDRSLVVPQLQFFSIVTVVSYVAF